MNVLYLNSSGQMGGAETSLSTLMESLRALHPDWRLTLLLGDDGPLARRAADLGAAVQVLAFPPELASFGFRGRPGRERFGSGLRALRAALQYRKQLKAALHAVGPDLIHTNGLKMHLLIASLSRRSFAGRAARVCHVHDYVGRSPLLRWLAKIAFRRFDRVVANSNSLLADLRAIPLPEHRMMAIHNGVSLQRFSPIGELLNLDRLCGLPEAGSTMMRVGMVATFAKWKGHSTFLRALALLPPELKVRGYVIGGPIYQTAGSQYTLAELRAAAAQYCPKVELGFTGVVGPVEAAYRALDIVVHASTEPEPFGMVISEAMASERALIVSRSGGAQEIFVEEVTALAYAPGDAAMLAQQIERLTRDGELRQRLGRKAREAVSTQFVAETMGVKFAHLYGTLVASRQAATNARIGGRNRCFA